MTRKALWRAISLLIVLSLAAPFVQASPAPAAAVDEFAVTVPEDEKPESSGAEESGKWKLVSSDRPAVQLADSAVYIIQLEAAPVASYRGGVEGLEATNPSVQGQVQLDAQSPASTAYANYLDQRQTAFLAAAERALERPVQTKHRYKYAFNGVAAELTPEEAAEIASLPGVIRVERDVLLQPTTHSSPEWIGATGIWDGATTGGLPGTKGEGIVAGILDTGINMDNPSFAATGDDGYTHVNPLGAGNYLGLCATEPGTFVCNSKLIGAWDFVDEVSDEEDGPEDSNGHGSHTASTVAGNVIYSPTIEAPTIVVTLPETSGVAPHANIVAYDVCYSAGCPNSATMAAKDQAIIDGVDVINYSIGGGGANPWTDTGSLSWLGVRDAGIFAATSAGNDGPGAATMGSPGNSPWILSVGATTFDQTFLNDLVDMEGGDSPPDDIQGRSITAGYGPAPIVHARDYGDALCLEPFPEGTFDGEIVVCDRGEIARVGKGANVLAGGAGGYVLANDEANGPSLNADPHVLPAVHITYEDGEKLRAWLSSSVEQTARITGSRVAADPSFADIMAAFSSRGPNPDGTLAAGILKPDLSAPGVDIPAAYREGIEFSLLSGTSMASPHAAGAGALLRALHPDWTAAEIQSVLMMTAQNEGILDDDQVTATNPFDTGSGRVELTAAGGAGLVLHETTENFENADPDEGGDPTTLNLASLANDLCLQQCSWERTFRSTVDVESTYTAMVDAPPNMTVMVNPPTFTVPAYGTQVVEIEADVTAMTVDQWAFAEVGFETDGVVPTFTADWEEGFEVAYPPTGWATYALGDAGDPGFVPTRIAHSGNFGVAHFDDDLASPADSWLVTSQFTPTAQTELAFWYLTIYDSFYDYHAIWVSDGSGDPADGDFVELAEIDQGTAGTWQRATESLGAYAGTPIHVAFRYQGDYADWWVIDDVLVGEKTGEAPISDLHMPMAVRPSRGVLPDLIDVETRRNAGSQLVEDLQAIEITDLTIQDFGLVEGELTTEMLSEDSNNGSPYDDLTDGVFYVTKTVLPGAKRIVGEIISSDAPDIDLFIGRDLDGDGPEESEEVCSSTTPSFGEYCDVSDLDVVAGTWWILVQNWSGSASQPDEVVLSTAVVPGFDLANMAVTGPTSVPEKDEFDLRLFWDVPGMEAGDHWYGAIALGSDPANLGNVGSIPVNVVRLQDDVTKSVSPPSADPGDTVTYNITIQPDITGQELTYFIADTLPDDLTYVPGSATAGSGTLSVVGNRLTWSGKVIPPREYLASTSLDDPLCGMPLASLDDDPGDSYLNLEAFGFRATPGVAGDNVAYQDPSYPGGPFAFFGDPRTSNLYFTDDGFVSLDIPSVLSGPYVNASIPTADLPNALMALMWNDLEIVYEDGSGEGNRGVTTGIYLTSGGVPVSKLLEFDDVQLKGDPGSQLDYELMVAEAVNDGDGAYEIIFAYDNLTGDFNSLDTGTIGVEDYDGLAGTEYAYNDANLGTLEDGMAICFDYRIPPKPLEITYQATVDNDAAGTLTNAVWHNTDNPGSRPEMVSAELTVSSRLYLPVILNEYTPPTKVTILHNNDGESELLPGDDGFGGVAHFASVVEQVRTEVGDDYPLLLVTSGDNFLAGPEWTASVQKGVPFYDSIALDLIGYDAMCLGNHDFDFGPDTLADFIEGFTMSQVPFLSANLDFSQEPALQALVDADRIAASIIVEDEGERLGIIGATTPNLTFISSPGGVDVGQDVQVAVQTEIDALEAVGVNKIILISHLQGIEEDMALAPRLRGLDVMIAGGGDELLANPDDLLVPGDESDVHGPYPLVVKNAEGVDVPVVTTSGEYRYLGRLDVSFDRRGRVVSFSGGPIRVAGGDTPDAVEPDADIADQVVDPVASYVEALDENVLATSEVPLDGRRNQIRSRETNEGDLIGDSFLWKAEKIHADFGAPAPDIALGNGGGIRNDSIIPAGAITELDTFDMLPFPNFLTIVPDVTPEEFKELLENAVSRINAAGAAEGEGTGRFAQIGGFSFTYDSTLEEGSRVMAATLDSGTVMIEGGAIAPTARNVNVVVVDFLARGGDEYFGGRPGRDDFIILGTSYQQALADYLGAPAAQGGLDGTISSSKYPVGGDGRIVNLAVSP